MIDRYQGVALCGQHAAGERIIELRERGEVSAQMARGLFGDLLALQEFGPAGFPDLVRAARAERELRRRGVAFERSLMPNVCVDISSVLSDAAAAWALEENDAVFSEFLKLGLGSGQAQ